MMTREICKICYHVNTVGFHVADDIWQGVVPPEFQNGVVCLGCFTRLADEKYIKWDQDIQFYPISLVTMMQQMEEFWPMGPGHQVLWDKEIPPTQVETKTAR